MKRFKWSESQSSFSRTSRRHIAKAGKQMYMIKIAQVVTSVLREALIRAHF